MERILGFTVETGISLEHGLDVKLTLLDTGQEMSRALRERHVRIFQGHGIVSGVRGTTVMLDRVPADDGRRIARYCRVQRLSPAKEPRS
jgi:hypothetical protein